MLRFLRTLFILTLTLTVCIALICLANQSTDVWGCLRYPNATNAGSVLVDVQNGNYRIEPPFAPIRYLNNTLRWFPNATGDSVLYYAYNATGLYRIGVIDNTYTHKSIDNQTKPSTELSVQSSSSNSAYLLISTLDKSRWEQAVALHDAKTLIPLTPPTIIPLSRTTDYLAFAYKSWSVNDQWVGFVNPASESANLIMMSSRGGEAQFIPIAYKEVFKLAWSPTESAVAVLSGEIDHNNFRVIDVLTLNNGRWEVSKTLETFYKSDVSTKWGFVDAAWTLDGKALLTTEIKLDPSAFNDSYELRVYHVDQQTFDSTLVPLRSAQLVLAAASTWICSTRDDGNYSKLISLFDTQQPIQLTSQACYSYPSPDGKTILVKQQTSDYPDGRWLGIKATPFTVTPLSLSSGENTTLDLIVEHWSSDSRFAFFYLPDAKSSLATLEGQYGVLDTATWETKLVQQSVTITWARSFSPDASRYTVWSVDGRHILLLDAESQLVAELLYGDPSADPYQAGIRWSPDSSRFIVTDMSANGNAMMSVFTRDGQRVSTFRRPPYLMTWHDESPVWTNCQAAPRLSHSWLPQ